MDNRLIFLYNLFFARAKFLEVCELYKDFGSYVASICSEAALTQG